MPLFGNRLICTHIHDNDCMYDHDMHMIPFDGAVDYDRVTRQIRESGFFRHADAGGSCQKQHGL